MNHTLSALDGFISRPLEELHLKGSLAFDYFGATST